MPTELHPADMHRVVPAYQMLLVVDRDASTSDSREIVALRLLHEEGLICMIESTELASTSDAARDEYEVDADLYSFVHGLLHPELDGAIPSRSCADVSMQIAKAVRHGADVFVTSDSAISHRDGPFERQTDMHLLEPTEALELVMQEINNAD